MDLNAKIIGMQIVLAGLLVRLGQKDGVQAVHQLQAELLNAANTIGLPAGPYQDQLRADVKKVIQETFALVQHQ